jgi:L-threonylcarbamoyladenylate synthase
MTTRIEAADERGIAHAAPILRDGGLVVFPTETFYGLAANPFHERAARRLYAAKRREADKPILLLIAKIEQLAAIVQEIPDVHQNLMRRFWPGPLTLVFPAQPHLSPLLTAGTATIALRQTSHPAARMLIDAFGQPITGTSANFSGQKPARTISQLPAELLAACDLILDGGPTPGGQPSTVVGLKNGEPVMLRQGAIDIGLPPQTRRDI